MLTLYSNSVFVIKLEISIFIVVGKVCQGKIKPLGRGIKICQEVGLFFGVRGTWQPHSTSWDKTIKEAKIVLDYNSLLPFVSGIMIAGTVQREVGGIK